MAGFDEDDMPEDKESKGEKRPTDNGGAKGNRGGAERTPPAPAAWSAQGTPDNPAVYRFMIQAWIKRFEEQSVFGMPPFVWRFYYNVARLLIVSLLILVVLAAILIYTTGWVTTVLLLVWAGVILVMGLQLLRDFSALTTQNRRINVAELARSSNGGIAAMALQYWDAEYRANNRWARDAYRRFRNVWDVSPFQEIPGAMVKELQDMMDAERAKPVATEEAPGPSWSPATFVSFLWLGLLVFVAVVAILWWHGDIASNRFTEELLRPNPENSVQRSARREEERLNRDVGTFTGPGASRIGDPDVRHPQGLGFTPPDYLSAHEREPVVDVPRDAR